MTERFLLRGGCVLTLGAKTPNFRRADVLIDDGRVAEVGPGLRARDAEVVDAADAIVMPGFVDTHRHARRSLHRNLGDGSPAGDAAVPATPDDVYAATLIGLLGAVEAGITTVVDWHDAGVDDSSAEAALQAHTDAGLRTVLVHPSAELLRRLAEAAGPSTTVALGAGEAPADHGGLPADWAGARERGHRIHVHAGAGTTWRGVVSRLAREGVLGADVTIIHCVGLDEGDLDAVASSGASVSLTPSSEMAGGAGAPPVQQLIDRGVRPGLGVDDERVAPGDMFAQMRQAISLQHATMFDLKLAGKAGIPRLMTTRDVIRYATFEAARAAGLGEVAGSLEPGKQADVIVLRTDRPNIFPVNDPIGAVVWGMDTSNVDWVFAGGRVLMREGVLQADVERARKLAAEARERVSAAARLPARATARSEG
ncbi:MAG TPA: amidohydrolase family protein [Actinomycetota bacterium]|nr:amidohydrolase family protein [Actinomycetota bacterium]